VNVYNSIIMEYFFEALKIEKLILSFISWN